VTAPTPHDASSPRPHPHAPSASTIIERRTLTPDDTEQLAASFARMLVAGDVILLDGPMGAGKTCFARGLARGLGIDPRAVASPTFIIRHDHDSPHDRALTHIDAWRLTSPADLDTIGFDELIARRDAIVAIEWPQRIPSDRLPPHAIRIEIDVLPVIPAHARIQTPPPSESEQAALPTTRLFRFILPRMLADRFASLQPRTRPCRACGRAVSIDEPAFPFCSDRCRLADLNAWFEGRHAISRPITDADEEIT